MSIAEKFRWGAIDDEQFEELVFKVLKSANPQQIEWRKGPGDQVREEISKYTFVGKVLLEMTSMKGTLSK
jgi:hypothetical protein